MNARGRILARLLTATTLLVCGACATEAAFRAIDGFHVLSNPLRASVARTDDERPQPIPRIPLPPELQRRAEANPTEPGNLRDFYYFDSLDGSHSPTDRHLPTSLRLVTLDELRKQCP